MGKRLYVGNLPYDADEAALRAAFAQDGRSVERVHIVIDRETQRPRGFAFVEMATEEQARQAIATMDGTVLGTRQLRVTEAEDRRPSSTGGPPGPRSGGAPRQDRSEAGSRFSDNGAPRHASDDAARANRFGPDAKPKREREQEMRRAHPRRRDESDDEGRGGRRGSSRYDDDDE